MFNQSSDKVRNLMKKLDVFLGPFQNNLTSINIDDSIFGKLNCSRII